MQLGREGIFYNLTQRLHPLEERMKEASLAYWELGTFGHTSDKPDSLLYAQLWNPSYETLCISVNTACNSQWQMGSHSCSSNTQATKHPLHSPQLHITLRGKSFPFRPFQNSSLCSNKIFHTNRSFCASKALLKSIMLWNIALLSCCKGELHWFWCNI